MNNELKSKGLTPDRIEKALSEIMSTRMDSEYAKEAEVNTRGPFNEAPQRKSFERVMPESNLSALDEAVSRISNDEIRVGVEMGDEPNDSAVANFLSRSKNNTSLNSRPKFLSSLVDQNESGVSCDPTTTQRTNDYVDLSGVTTVGSYGQKIWPQFLDESRASAPQPVNESDGDDCCDSECPSDEREVCYEGNENNNILHSGSELMGESDSPMDCDAEIGPEDINLGSDIIGYKTPKAMFNREIKRGAIYIPLKNNPGYFAPIDHQSNKYYLPKEIVCDWEKVTDGSRGFYMTLNRKDDQRMDVRYDAEYVWFGREKASFEQFQQVLMGHKLMVNQRNLPWSVSIDTINIGCQKGVYVSDLFKLYYEMNKLNANR